MSNSRRSDVSLFALMADLHHEIRSPVNTILNMTELALKEMGADPSMEHFLKTIERSANSLMTILDDIIELSQDDIDTAGSVQAFGLTDLLEDLKEAVSGPSSARGTRLYVSIEDDTPEWFLGARGRARQVLTQVYNYCMRQLGARKIEVQVGVSTEELPHSLAFYIHATGIESQGIEPKDVLRNPRILICKRLLMDLDNDLEVKKDISGTMTFHFSLQVDPIDRPWGIPIYPTPIGCLVGEPSMSSSLVARRLAGCGFRVEYAQDLDRALKTLERAGVEGRRALVLADWQSLDQSGALDGVLLQEGAYPVPVLFFDVPALKMLEIGSRVSSSGGKAPGVGLVMAPSKGGQVLAEVLRLLRMEPDQLSCHVSEDDDQGEISISQDKLRGMKVLVVEDDRINQKIVVEILKKFHVKPVVASTGKMALKAVERHLFDAIFMDINLPDTDGYKLTEEIRRIAQYEHVPIIALTASTKNRQLCMEAGMDYFLSKPYSEAKLMKSLIHTMKDRIS